MKREILNKHLQDLHEQLKSVAPDTSEGREKVEHLNAQIRSQLSQSGDVEPADHNDLLQALRGAVEHFEGTHDQLTVRISTLINLLSSSGF
jgi:phospholipase/lecithinase/hemolysin